MSEHAPPRAPADLIAGAWVLIPGSALRSRSPAHPPRVVWSGSPRAEHVDRAIAAARGALPAWSRAAPEHRAAVLRAFRDIATRRQPELAAVIRDEVGKPHWDALAEAQLLATKVDITLDRSEHAPLRRVSRFDVTVGTTRTGRCDFRPHGVMGVLAPFNFPAHLPNGHIIPALAMGNTVVFKPSDKAPATGQLLAEMLDEACRAEGAPPGVVNLVHGGGDIAAALVRHDGLDGVLFTGSWPVGRRIIEANLDRPGRILALEMGGNNPAVILPDADARQAVIECVRSAFITAGQRCTCTRRVIVHEGVAGRVIPAIVRAASNLAVGDPAGPEPVFMGPLVTEPARRAVLDAQRAMLAAGGEALLTCEVPAKSAEGWYLSPGVIRVPRFVKRAGAPAAHLRPAHEGLTHAGEDVEVFGPLLRVSTARDLDDALDQANATDFGLAAAIFTRDPGAIDRFLAEIRAGCINVNCGTAGASSKLPFGGLGLSGNHRPAGAFSLDYCAYPVAAMIETAAAATLPPGMRFDEQWLG